MAAIDATGMLLVGRYRLGRRVGGGGMGAVHEARDERVGRRVAVKVLHPQLAREKQHVLRFLREARAAAGLLHPHIVQVLDVSGADDDGPPFLVMEFLTGQSLAGMLQDERRLAAGRVARLARQLLSALAAAHAVGIVHRDMKPGNIIVQRGYDGREISKIVDFGIAKLMDSQSYTRLTATGEILGTPAFMAPEQLTGSPIDGRADIYGVGAIVYNCIVGEPAVGRGTLPEVAQRALTGDHVPLSNRIDVHPGLSDVVERALAVDPNARFADAAEMSDALVPFEDPTDALLIPEHRVAPLPTRVTPSVRPGPAPAIVIPATSETPPPVAASAPAGAVVIPKTGERPSPRRSPQPIPATGERKPAAAPSPASAPAAVAEPTRGSRRRGLLLAGLAFAGSVIGAGAVGAFVLFAKRDAAPAVTAPTDAVPVGVPMAVVPAAPIPAPLPMIPSQPVTPVTPDASTDAGDSTDAGEAGVDAAEEPRRRRRRRRRPRGMRAPERPPPASDEPLFTIPPERVRELTMMSADSE